jgi:hypothetical protein
MRLILTFYRSFVVVSSLITIACVGIISINGLKTLTAVLLFKTATSGIIILFLNQYKKKEFYYYHNLGFSRVRLWVFSLGIDLAIFVQLIAMVL